MVLLQGALGLAREHGLTDVMLRCLINIGYGAPDPQLSLRASEEALQESLRVGDRSHASFVAANLAGAYSLAMDHDGMERIVDADLWRDADRVSGLSIASELHRRRGNDAKSDAAMDEARRIAQTISDPQSVLAVERGDAGRAIHEGRGRDVFEVARRHFHETSFAPGISVAFAVAGASIAKDRELLQEAADMADELVTNSLTARFRRWAGAMIAIFEGDHAGGAAVVDDLVKESTDVNTLWQAFMIRVLAARLLPPDHPKRMEYIEEARKIAEDTGAPGLLTWIDRMTA
jgi:hypothetical protein